MKHIILIFLSFSINGISFCEFESLDFLYGSIYSSHIHIFILIHGI